MPRSLSASGMLALPLAFAVSALAVVATAAQPRKDPARVELELAGVLPMPEDAGCILVLREKGRRTILPVLVAGADARDLPARLRSRRAPGLLGATLEALGARVREVQLASADETAGAARVRLAQGGHQVDVDARPSESIALAVSAGAPIFTTRAVLDENGLTPEDLEHAKGRASRERAHGVRL